MEIKEKPRPRPPCPLDKPCAVIALQLSARMACVVCPWYKGEDDAASKDSAG